MGIGPPLLRVIWSFRKGSTIKIIGFQGFGLETLTVLGFGAPSRSKQQYSI